MKTKLKALILFGLLKSNFIFSQNTFPSTGPAGISTTPFTPIYFLDVNGGDINLNSSTNAYRIGDGSTGNSFAVLWHNGQIENIFVGVGAGNTNVTRCEGFVILHPLAADF